MNNTGIPLLCCYLLGFIENDPEPVYALERACCLRGAVARNGTWFLSLKTSFLRFRQSQNLIPMLVDVDTARALAAVTIVFFVIGTRSTSVLFGELGCKCGISRYDCIKVR